MDISGYKKYSYQQINVDNSASYFTALGELGASNSYLSGPWQERLELTIIGRLSERLSVSYDLEQQPEVPERYHVKVDYDNHELTFGDFSVNFSGNEFASATKTLNGVLFTSHDSWYDLTLVPSAKIQSYSIGLTSQVGNGTAGPYSLGHTSIVEGSEYVELNSVKLSNGKDYTIDYFGGKITFNRIINTTDTFKYSYEYTNIIDIFFPAVSNRNFFGLRTSFNIDPNTFLRPAPKEEPLVYTESEIFPACVTNTKTISREVSVTAEVKALGRLAGTVEEASVFINGEEALILHSLPGQKLPIERAEIIAGRLSKLAESEISPEALISLGSVEGEWVGLANGSIIFTLDRREAEFQGITAEALAKTWVGNIKELIKPRTAIVTSEVCLPVEEIPPEFQEQQTGIYQLAHYPIVRFSESIIFEGSRLKKDEDYKIDYETGEIRMLTPKLPTSSDTMKITYNYYMVADESEILPGINSRGPYSLAHGALLPDSEKVTINNMPTVRDLDYTIDYDNGKITFFNKVLSTQNINIKYRYVSKKLPPAPEEAGPFNKVRIGTTFLRESSKKGEGQPTGSGYETPVADTIIGQDNTLYLQNYPIDRTSVTITVNGSAQAYGIDFAVPSTEVVGGSVIVIPSASIGFLKNGSVRYINDPTDFSDGEDAGTIKFLTPPPSGASIEVTYSYYKSMYNMSTTLTPDHPPTKGVPGPYTFQGIKGIVPGSERVTVLQSQGNNTWKEVPCYPNKSTTEVQPVNGYKINYSNLNGPIINFNDGSVITTNDDRIRIEFYYVPAAAPTGNDISQQIVGLDADTTLNNFAFFNTVKVSGSVAKSSIDKVYGSLTTSESFIGNGTRTFTLHSPTDIMDDSDQVYRNGYLLTKDDDYSISYTAPGMVSFYVNVSTNDAISITYNYLDSTVSSTKKKEDIAGRISLSGKVGDVLELSTNFKQVGPDFSGMGGLPLAPGSNYKDYSITYKPLSYFSVQGAYKNTMDLVSPLKEYRNFFLKTDEYDLSSTSTILDAFDLTVGFRQLLREDQPLTPGGLHNSDTRDDVWTTAITPKTIKLGEISYTNHDELSKTISKTDVIDRIAGTTNNINYLRTSNSFKFSNWANFSVDYQLNEPILTSTVTTSEPSVSTKEEETAHTRTNDIRYTTDMDLTGFTYGTIKKLTTMAMFNTVDTFDFIREKMHLNSLASTRNQSFNVELDPIDQVQANFHNDRSETPSTFTETVGNPVSERSTFDTRFTPYSFANFSWGGNWSDSIDNGGSKVNSIAFNYSANYTPPLPRAIFDIGLPTDNMSIATKYSGSEMLTRSTPYQQNETKTKNRDDAVDVNLSYIPHPLWTLSSGLNLDRYLNEDTTGAYADTFNTTYRVGATFKPDPSLDLTANLNRKETKDNSTDISRPKVVFDAHATWRPFAYGSLTYDYMNNVNRGEVTAGSVAAMDLLEITNGITFSVSLPQDNVVLSSIVIDAKWKEVSYHDFLTSSNTFNANILSLEGTLNF